MGSEAWESKELSGFDFGVTIEACYFDGSGSLSLEFEEVPGSGLDTIYERTLSGVRRELMVPGGDCRIILHKIDPRSQTYKAGRRLVRETHLQTLETLGNCASAELSALVDWTVASK